MSSLPAEDFLATVLCRCSSGSGLEFVDPAKITEKYELRKYWQTLGLRLPFWWFLPKLFLIVSREK